MTQQAVQSQQQPQQLSAFKRLGMRIAYGPDWTKQQVVTQNIVEATNEAVGATERMTSRGGSATTAERNHAYLAQATPKAIAALSAALPELAGELTRENVKPFIASIADPAKAVDALAGLERQRIIDGTVSAIAPQIEDVMNMFNMFQQMLGFQQPAPQQNWQQPGPQQNWQQPAPQQIWQQPAPQQNWQQPAPQPALSAADIVSLVEQVLDRRLGQNQQAQPAAIVADDVNAAAA